MSQDILNKIDGIEQSIQKFQDKAKGEMKLNGEVAQETKNVIEKLGVDQREVADRLLALEQSGVSSSNDSVVKSMGGQFVDSDSYKNFVSGSAQKARMEIVNTTTTGSDATVAPDRKPGVVSGAIKPLTLESFLTSIPTSSNAIEYTRESAMTNNAAEVAEAGAKAETAITFALNTMPVSTIAHWVKISKQLAADAPALAAYVNTRMAYGVNLRVEQQLGAGDGVSPNISGLLDSGNFTAHGYSAANIGATLPKHVLIRKMIADAWAAGYPADAIVMNPADVATLEIEALTTTAGQMRMSVNAAGQPLIFGLPVVQSIGITAGQVLVGAFGQSATVHNRQGVMVELSESDGSNFTTNLVTVRAERRLALTVERPAGIIAGTLTPA